MVNLFSRRRKNDTFRGFGRYHDEIERYTPVSPQGATSPLMASSAAAAAAAVRLHSPTNPLSPASTAPKQQPSRRTASLTRNSTPLPYTNHDRSNSLRSYTYNPRASYVTGQPRHHQNQRPAPAPQQKVIPRRYNSLTDATRRLNSLSSQNSNLRRNSIDELVQELGEDEEVTVTTQTTEIVDALGRTQSITTRTTKQLPDGSNIIETITKSVSRGGSRANSLRADSLVSRQNTNANTNLTIIDEDLQDFDYNYHLDNPKLAAAVPLVLNQQEPTSPTNYYSPPPPKLVPPPAIKDNATSAERNNSIILNGSPKPLILKHRHQEAEPEPDYADARDSFPSSTSPHLTKGEFSPPAAPSAGHPYKSLSNSPTSGLYQNQKLGPPITTTESHSKPNGHPTHENASTFSGNNSIKFNDVVETIPYTPEEEKDDPVYVQRVHVPVHTHVPVLAAPVHATPKSQSHQKRDSHAMNDEEMYAAAYEAAKRKVYGDRAAEVSPTAAETRKPVLATLRSPGSPQSPAYSYNAAVSHSSPVAASATSTALANVVNGSVGAASATLAAVTISQLDPKLSKSIAKQGIPKDYHYEAHNKPLSAHTLRGSENIKSAAHEQRVLAKQKEKEIREQEKHEREIQKTLRKEEVKKQKDIDKQQKKALKQLEKQKKLEAKAAKKQQKGFLFFKRPSMESERRTSTDTNPTSAIGDTTLESSTGYPEASVPMSIPPPIKETEPAANGNDISKSVFAVMDNYTSESRSQAVPDSENHLPVSKNQGVENISDTASKELLDEPNVIISPNPTANSLTFEHQRNEFINGAGDEGANSDFRAPMEDSEHEENEKVPAATSDSPVIEDSALVAGESEKQFEVAPNENAESGRVLENAPVTSIPEPSVSPVASIPENEEQEVLAGSTEVGGSANESTLEETNQELNEMEVESEEDEAGKISETPVPELIVGNLPESEGDGPQDSGIKEKEQDNDDSIDNNAEDVSESMKSGTVAEGSSIVDNNLDDINTTRTTTSVRDIEEMKKNFIVIPSKTPEPFGTSQHIELPKTVDESPAQVASTNALSSQEPVTPQPVKPLVAPLVLDNGELNGTRSQSVLSQDVSRPVLDNSETMDTLNVTNGSYESFTPDVSRNVRESSHFIEVLDFDESQPEDGSGDEHTIEQKKATEQMGEVPSNTDTVVVQGNGANGVQPVGLTNKPGDSDLANLENQQQVPKKKMGKFRRNMLKYFVNGYDKV